VIVVVILEHATFIILELVIGFIWLPFQDDECPFQDLNFFFFLSLFPAGRVIFPFVRIEIPMAISFTVVRHEHT